VGLNDSVVVPGMNSSSLSLSILNTHSIHILSSLSNIQNSHFWLKQFIGVVKKLEEYYQYFIPQDKIKTVLLRDCEHAMITTNYGNPCLYLGLPYINKCPNMDAAGELLNWIYGYAYADKEILLCVTPLHLSTTKSIG
jgi:hypothetical protein